jgi:hypothetical protein
MTSLAQSSPTLYTDAPTVETVPHKWSEEALIHASVD